MLLSDLMSYQIKLITYNNANNHIPLEIQNIIQTKLINHPRNDRPNRLSKSILLAMRDLGWSRNVPIEAGHKTKIMGIYQNIGLVVYFGNHFTGYHYILNLEYMYRMGKIKAAIYITQTENEAVLYCKNKNPKVETTGNYMQYERFIEDINLYSSFLTIPLIIIGIEGSD